jgi:hypothetical protein
MGTSLDQVHFTAETELQLYDTIGRYPNLPIIEDIQVVRLALQNPNLSDFPLLTYLDLAVTPEVRSLVLEEARQRYPVQPRQSDFEKLFRLEQLPDDILKLIQDPELAFYLYHGLDTSLAQRNIHPPQPNRLNEILPYVGTVDSYQQYKRSYKMGSEDEITFTHTATQSGNLQLLDLIHKETTRGQLFLHEVIRYATRPKVIAWVVDKTPQFIIDVAIEKAQPVFHEYLLSRYRPLIARPILKYWLSRGRSSLLKQYVLLGGELSLRDVLHARNPDIELMELVLDRVALPVDEVAGILTYIVDPVLLGIVLARTEIPRELPEP